MTNSTKVCARCKQEKPLTEFYTRASNRQSYLSECKACMAARSQAWHQNNDPHVPQAKSEVIVMDKLASVGISTLPGKAVAVAYADIVAWGCVPIECKFSYEDRLGAQTGFLFVTTPSQQGNGFTADLVILVCEYADTHRTFHVFDARDPVFYINRKGIRRVKTGITYVPGRTHAKKFGADRVVMTEQMMSDAQDRWDLIEAKRIDVINKLMNQ